MRRALLVTLATLAAVSAEDWPFYGRDAGGMRHSPLADITPSNAARLKVAWTYRTGDVAGGKGPRSSFQATPLLIDGTLFVVTPFNRIIALDPETGAEKWVYDPSIRREGDYGDGFTCRGIAAWRDPSTGKLRLYAATQDGRLIAIYAENGREAQAFGPVDLTAGVAQRRRGEYHFTSPPAVIGDVVVVGSSINDNNRAGMPAGTVRGFDARTGALRWSWDPIPPDRDVKTGAANAWAVMSVDEERDLVFIPTGSASPDFYGGARPGDNRYANSVVALRGSTGELVWHFQTVHHDLWDYDVAPQPMLIPFTRGGRTVAAVAQATKMGHLFVLDRETGEPLLPVEERKVPPSDVPGEKASPTQPFPVLPPPMSAYRLRPEDAWGITFWDRGKCREQIASARNEGIFTPPSLRGTVMFPGNAGGTNWGGLSFDPVRGIAVVNESRVPFFVRLYKRGELDQARKDYPGAEIGRMEGTPYIMVRKMLTSPIGLPCNPPPWGMLHGVHLATGQIQWSVPLGTIRDVAPVPLPLKWGTPNLGGPVTTGGGVTFIAATMDYYLRAFDTASGNELWKGRLPASAQATPMTYRGRKGGRQYVVICAGGHAKLDVMKQGDYVIAYALP
ncbi:MAG: pyrroloquinoline quinone-dependent dehydrogenase [Bryobacteraceae bacterium]|nr:pyrroloquinoline quinone-dependent dehydrogenase [Bryobacteraceae bacterium]